MSSPIFRQVSLERLSSPEQLDQLLRITGPNLWLGLVAVFCLMGSGVVWGYWGTVVSTAGGQGIIVRAGGVLNLVSRGSGTVLNLNVHVGDRVRANEVVGTIAQPALVEKRNAMRAAVADAKREREHALDLHLSLGKLQVEAVDRQRANDQQQIQELRDRYEVTKQQMLSEEQLLAKGLVTQQQVLGAKEKLFSIQDEIAGLNAHIKQLDAEKQRLQEQPDQDDAEARSRIAMMERDLNGVEKELAMAEEVVSPYPGQVLELKVTAGSRVEAGQAIVSLQPDVPDLELLAYVPSFKAKEIRSGMDVQVSPSTVKREEFGFVKGTVTYVSEYPATTAALMGNFENELLVSALTAAGPVTELHIRLDPDPRSFSGFKWSASRGPAVKITAGTLCSVEVVTRHQRPIDLVVPYMKGGLGME